MAVMNTVLTEYANTNNGNSRTSTLVNHTTVKPRLVIEKRKVATTDDGMNEYAFKVVIATLNAEGLILSQKISFEGIARYPTAGTMTDVTAALAIFRDIVAGDEFAASVPTTNWMKP